MLEKLFLFFQGYLILELCGDSKERFINLCKNKEIEIIQIFMINNTWYCKMRCRDYKIIRPFVKKTGCKNIIKEKKGYPFLIRKLKMRKGLLIGSVFFFMIVTQCAGRIWHISVDGGFLHTREQIMQVMQSELGVYGGVPGSQVDCFEIEKRLRLDYNEIGWISVEKRGSRLFVMLNESTMPNQAVVREVPGHIVAEQDGIVRKIEVKTGIPQVKVGDEVKKGDILISGVVPIIGDYDEIIRNEPVAADGKVFLESDFSYNARLSMVYEKKNYTKKQSGLEIFLSDRKLFSYIPRYSEGKYDIMSIDIVPYAFDDYEAPVLLKKYSILSYDTELIQLSESEVKEKAKQNWEAFLKDWEAQNVEIIKADFIPEIKKKVCYISGAITACGNFISYQEILKEEWETENEYRGDNP